MAKQDISFNVLAYNINAWPKIVEQTAQTERLHLITDKIKELNNDVDVVSLSNFFINSDRSNIVDKMYANGYKYTTGVLPRNPVKLLNGGVQLFSKHPIENMEWTTYLNCASYDCLTSKGSLFCRVYKTIKGKCYPFNIFSSNLQTEHKDTQDKQQNQLKSFINTQKDRFLHNEPIIIVDNLNNFSFDGVVPTNTQITDASPTFKLKTPIINSKYCPDTFGTGTLRQPCKISKIQIYDLSKDKPMLGKFTYKLDGLTRCDDLKISGKNIGLSALYYTGLTLEYIIVIVLLLVILYRILDKYCNLHIRLKLLYSVALQTLPKYFKYKKIFA